MTSPVLARSDYFDLAWYARIQERVRGWQDLGPVPAGRAPSDADRRACEDLLFAEARLIDRGALTEWLDLFVDDCAYWIPADVSCNDPRLAVSWEFNDRRRLEERVERLATGFAYSQIPATRTVHLYSNLEMMTSGADEMDVLCSFLIQTSLNGRKSQRAGWNGFVLRRTAAGWKIVLKRVSLYDADGPQENNSFTL